MSDKRTEKNTTKNNKKASKNKKIPTLRLDNDDEYYSYKYYVFYEHDDEYIPLKIILKDVVGYNNDYKDNGKTMNFKLDDGSLNKIYEIFGHVEE